MAAKAYEMTGAEIILYTTVSQSHFRGVVLFEIFH